MPDRIMEMNLIFLFGFVAGAGVCGLFIAYLNLKKRIKDLEARIDQGPKRLPYKSADSIENATAAILSVMQEHHWEGERLQNALSHLQQARNPDK